MADIEAMDGVAAGSIEAVNGVAKADIQAINGLTVPASGASLWTIVGADGAVATAAASDLNAWTGYVSGSMGSTDYNAIGYGKDGSGNPLWVAVNSNGTKEIRYSSDPTNTSGWSDVNPSNPGKLYAVLWGNDVWMAVGQNGEVWRSTDGSTWSEVDMSGVTNWATTGVDVRHLASDGAGKWMTGNDQYIFVSTNDGAAWTELYDCADAPVSDDSYEVRGIAYTVASGTARWCALVRKSGNTRVIHAAAADTTSWTLATVDGSAASGQDTVAHSNRHIAAGAGTVIMAVGNDFSRSTNGGQDWTYTTDSDGLPRTDARGLATDGNGNWVVVHDNGRVSINTEDGAPGEWNEQSGNNATSGDLTRLAFPTGGTNVENLDAIAANVLLPL